MGKNIMETKKLIAGNWKMNGSGQMAEGLARAVADFAKKHPEVEVLICPPALYIERAKRQASGVLHIGGQDCHAKPAGAHTGDISGEMLKDAGCDYVLAGHSERRANHNEDNACIADKAAAAMRAGLVPVICVGEQESTRETGDHIRVVTMQIQNSIPKEADPSKLVLAYEPVWAIGMGKTASLEDVAEMHDTIRALLVGLFGKAGEGIRILYGGSVKPDNAFDILSLKNVGGVLVGGASLKADDFNAIIKAGSEA